MISLNPPLLDDTALMKTVLQASWWTRFWCRHQDGFPLGEEGRAYVQCNKCGRKSPGIVVVDTLKRDTTPRKPLSLGLRKPIQEQKPELGQDFLPGGYLWKRRYGKFSGKGFTLSPDFTWGIEEDEKGVLVLVPAIKGDGA